MEIYKILEWVFASPLFVALFSTIISYPLLPKCNKNKEQDRQWAMRSCSTIFVVVFIISIIYLELNCGEVIHSVISEPIALEAKSVPFKLGIPNF